MLRRLIDKIPDPDPETLVAFHFIAMLVWMGPLFCLTVLVWKNSVLWVGIMSVYAAWVGHFSAFDAARAAVAAREK